MNTHTTTFAKRAPWGTATRNVAVVLSLITIVAVAVHAAVLHKHGQSSHRAKLEAFVRQGVGQLADLGRRHNAAKKTSWGTTTGPIAEQFRRWAWAVLQDEDVIAVALTDEQGRTLTKVPQDAAIPNEHFAGVGGDGVSARMVTVRLAELEKAVWRVAGVTRRSGSSASRAGVVLFAQVRPTSFEVARSVIGLAVAMVATAGVLVLVYGRWYARRIGRPLRTLAATADGLDSRSRKRLPTERNDEIGVVAQAIERLIKKVDRSEGRVERLERTMNSRVMDQTRRINAMLQRAERAAWVDPLTKVGSRRLLDDRLEKIFEGQQQTGEDMSIVALDLDNFKNLNDMRGHAAGDDMLRFVGDLLRGTLRPTDIAVRHGGDEFAVILLDTTPDEAAALTERLIRLFCQRAQVMALDPPVSMSAGIASMLRHRPQSGKDLLKLADQALYRAKARGKNRLCFTS